MSLENVQATPCPHGLIRIVAPSSKSFPPRKPVTIVGNGPYADVRNSSLPAAEVFSITTTTGSETKLKCLMDHLETPLLVDSKIVSSNETVVIKTASKVECGKLTLFWHDPDGSLGEASRSSPRMRSSLPALSVPAQKRDSKEGRASCVPAVASSSMRTKIAFNKTPKNESSGSKEDNASNKLTISHVNASDKLTSATVTSSSITMKIPGKSKSRIPTFVLQTKQKVPSPGKIDLKKETTLKSTLGRKSHVHSEISGVVSSFDKVLPEKKLHKPEKVVGPKQTKIKEPQAKVQVKRFGSTPKSFSTEASLVLSEDLSKGDCASMPRRSVRRSHPTRKVAALRELSPKLLHHVYGATKIGIFGTGDRASDKATNSLQHLSERSPGPSYNTSRYFSAESDEAEEVKPRNRLSRSTKSNPLVSTKCSLSTRKSLSVPAVSPDKKSREMASDDPTDFSSDSEEKEEISDFSGKVPNTHEPSDASLERPADHLRGATTDDSDSEISMKSAQDVNETGKHDLIQITTLNEKCPNITCQSDVSFGGITDQFSPEKNHTETAENSSKLEENSPLKPSQKHTKIESETGANDKLNESEKRSSRQHSPVQSENAHPSSCLQILQETVQGGDGRRSSKSLSRIKENTEDPNPGCSTGTKMENVSTLLKSDQLHYLQRSRSVSPVKKTGGGHCEKDMAMAFKQVHSAVASPVNSGGKVICEQLNKSKELNESLQLDTFSQLRLSLEAESAEPAYVQAVETELIESSEAEQVEISKDDGTTTKTEIVSAESPEKVEAPLADLTKTVNSGGKVICEQLNKSKELNESLQLDTFSQLRLSLEAESAEPAYVQAVETELIESSEAEQVEIPKDDGTTTKTEIVSAESPEKVEAPPADLTKRVNSGGKVICEQLNKSKELNESLQLDTFSQLRLSLEAESAEPAYVQAVETELIESSEAEQVEIPKDDGTTTKTEIVSAESPEKVEAPLADLTKSQPDGLHAGSVNPGVQHQDLQLKKQRQRTPRTPSLQRLAGVGTNFVEASPEVIVLSDCSEKAELKQTEQTSSTAVQVDRILLRSRPKVAVGAALHKDVVKLPLARITPTRQGEVETIEVHDSSESERDQTSTAAVQGETTQKEAVEFATRAELDEFDEAMPIVVPREEAVNSALSQPGVSEAGRILPGNTEDPIEGRPCENEQQFEEGQDSLETQETVDQNPEKVSSSGSSATNELKRKKRVGPDRTVAAEKPRMNRTTRRHIVQLTSSFDSTVTTSSDDAEQVAGPSNKKLGHGQSKKRARTSSDERALETGYFADIEIGTTRDHRKSSSEPATAEKSRKKPTCSKPQASADSTSSGKGKRKTKTVTSSPSDISVITLSEDEGQETPNIDVHENIVVKPPQPKKSKRQMRAVPQPAATPDASMVEEVPASTPVKGKRGAKAKKVAVTVEELPMPPTGRARRGGQQQTAAVVTSTPLASNVEEQPLLTPVRGKRGGKRQVVDKVLTDQDTEPQAPVSKRGKKKAVKPTDTETNAGPDVPEEFEEKPQLPTPATKRLRKKVVPNAETTAEPSVPVEHQAEAEFQAPASKRGRKRVPNTKTNAGPDVPEEFEAKPQLPAPATKRLRKKVVPNAETTAEPSVPVEHQAEAEFQAPASKRGRKRVPNTKTSSVLVEHETEEEPQAAAPAPKRGRKKVANTKTVAEPRVPAVQETEEEPQASAPATKRGKKKLVNAEDINETQVSTSPFKRSMRNQKPNSSFRDYVWTSPPARRTRGAAAAAAASK